MLTTSPSKILNVSSHHSWYQIWIGVLQAAVIGLVLVGLGMLIGARTLAQPDPFFQSLQRIQGDPARGATLFSLNCAACHGAAGDGRVGPSLQEIESRRSDHFIVERVTGGNTPPMPQFQVTPQEMADLLSYLKAL